MNPSLAPWLTVMDGHRAVEFYRLAFGAVEVYRMEVPDGSLVVRLSVGGSEFWVSGGPVTAVGGGSVTAPGGSVPGGGTMPAPGGESVTALGGGSVRMILTVADPDAVFARALAAGAREVFAVGEAHGWRLGRLEDPFGLHWEVGRELG